MCFTFFFYCQSQCQMLAGFSSENIKSMWTMHYLQMTEHLNISAMLESSCNLTWTTSLKLSHPLITAPVWMPSHYQQGTRCLSTASWGAQHSNRHHVWRMYTCKLWLDTTAFSYFLQGQDIQIFFMQVLCRKFLELTNKNGWTPLYHHAAAIFSNPVTSRCTCAPMLQEGDP